MSEFKRAWLVESAKVSQWFEDEYEAITIAGQYAEDEPTFNTEYVEKKALNQAQAEIAKLKAQLKEHNDELCDHLTIAHISGAEHAKDEIKRLRTALEKIQDSEHCVCCDQHSDEIARAALKGE